MSFEDHFSRHAADYARFRPNYPAALFEFLTSLSSRTDSAWDVACGTGQATRALASTFTRVIASDGSRAQLARLEAPDHVDRLCALAEVSGLAAGSVDLVCVAQALHWFDQERFQREVARVVRPGGIVAAFCYGLFELAEDAASTVLRSFHEDVGRYWPERRKLVEEGYASLELPWSTERHRFTMEASWTLDDMLGYLGTWTATKRCAEREGRDPVAELRSDLTAAWRSPDAGAAPGIEDDATPKRRVVWPIDLMWARAPGV